MHNDMTPAKTAGLLLMAAIMWGSLVVNSFFNDDSPIQVRVLNCHVAHPTARECPATLVWIGF